MGFLSNLFGGPGKINDYFADAVWVYMHTADPVVRLAALTAAKVAAGAQRASMVNYLRVSAADARELARSDDIAYRLNQLADEISLRDWTIGDVTHAKQALWKLDAEYGKALDKFDGRVFRRRFPELFRDSKRSAPLEQPTSEPIKKLRAELMKSGPLTPDQEEILESPGKVRDLLEIPSDAMEVVGAYSKVLAEDARLLKPLSALPYPKTRIEEALQIAMRNARDPAILRNLETALDALQDFIPDENVPADREENAKAWFMHRAARGRSGQRRGGQSVSG